MSKKDDEDEDLLMETLVCLEDMLFESVSLNSGNDDDDDEWNVPSSKYGEKFRSDLITFEERAISAFQKTISSSNNTSASDTSLEEFTLEQDELHREFGKLIESNIETFLMKRNSNINQLISQLKNASSSEGGGNKWKSDASKEIQSLLFEVDDIVLWGRNMRRKAIQRKQNHHK